MYSSSPARPLVKISCAEKSVFRLSKNSCPRSQTVSTARLSSLSAHRSYSTQVVPRKIVAQEKRPNVSQTVQQSAHTDCPPSRPKSLPALAVPANCPTVPSQPSNRTTKAKHKKIKIKITNGHGRLGAIGGKAVLASSVPQI